MLADGLGGNGAIGIGSTGDESVLLRSFSALDLSMLAAHDLDKPFLEPAAFRELLAAALDYLAREKDVRGFVPGSGWHHSTAHTADLLKFLARSPRLTPEDQSRILAGIGAKPVGRGRLRGQSTSGSRAVLAREENGPARDAPTLIDARGEQSHVEGDAVRPGSVRGRPEWKERAEVCSLLWAGPAPRGIRCGRAARGAPPHTLTFGRLIDLPCGVVRTTGGWAAASVPTCSRRFP
jgi:hypothetical protein